MLGKCKCSCFQKQVYLVSNWLVNDHCEKTWSMVQLLFSMHSEACRLFFYLIIYTILWNKHSHSSRKELKTSKHDKKYYPKWAWSFLFSHVIVYRQWSLYSGEFFHPSEHRCQWYPESPPDAGCQTGRAVVTWCLTAGLDSRRAASWHALCSTFSGTWSSEKKRGDLCEIRKEGRSKQTRKKIPQRKRQQNARHRVGNSHAEQ